MYFEDIVTITKSDCCEKCSSFEYDLPCRVDKNLVVEIAELLGEKVNADKFMNSSGTLQIKKDEEFKIELKSKSRYLKLCLPVRNTTFQEELNNLLANWISDTLSIGIERKNG